MGENLKRKLSSLLVIAMTACSINQALIVNAFPKKQSGNELSTPANASKYDQTATNTKLIDDIDSLDAICDETERGMLFDKNILNKATGSNAIVSNKPISNEDERFDDFEKATSSNAEEAFDMPEFDYIYEVDGYIIHICAEPDIFPKGTKTVVKKIEAINDQDVKKIMENSLHEGEKLATYVAFDITFYYNDLEIQPIDGSVQVSIQLASDIKIKENSIAKVFHIKDKDNVEEISTESFVEKEITYQAEHFSVYAVAIAEAGYIPIYTPEDLQNVSKDYLVNQYRLMNDIDLKNMKWDPIHVFGSEDGSLFDGNDHTIRNLYIETCYQTENDSTGYNYAGLFSAIDTVKNLKIENATVNINISQIEGKSNFADIGIVAGMVKKASNIHISDSNINVHIPETEDIYTSLGGMFGDVSDQVEGSSFSGDIFSEKVYNVGGIAGTANSIFETYSNGTITAIGSMGVGGVVGNALGVVERCYNDSDIYVEIKDHTVGESVGGVIGYHDKRFGRTSVAKDLYNRGDIRQCTNGLNGYAGGITGLLTSTNGIDTFTNCYNLGTVAKISTTIGSDTENLTYKNCRAITNGFVYPIDSLYFFDDNLKSQEDGATYLTLDQMQQQANFVGFDFNSVWKMGDDDYPYPILQWQKNISSGDKNKEFTVDFVTKVGTRSTLPSLIKELYTDNATQVNSQKINFGGYAHLPTPPSKPYYIFDGWYMDDLYKNKYTFDKPVFKDLVLYAKWQSINKNEIKFQDDMANFTNNIMIAVKETDYDKFRKQLNWSDGFKIAERMVNSKEKGICFGVSSAMIANKAGRINIESIQNDAMNFNDLDITKINVKSFLSLYHLAQYCSVYRDYVKKFAKLKQKQKLMEIVNAAPNNISGNPALITFQFIEGSETKGHAMIIDGIEAGDINIDGEKYYFTVKTYDINTQEGWRMYNSSYLFPQSSYIYISEDFSRWTIPNYFSNNAKGAKVLAVINDIGIIDAYNMFYKNNSKIGNNYDKDNTPILLLPKDTSNKYKLSTAIGNAMIEDSYVTSSTMGDIYTYIDVNGGGDYTETSVILPENIGDFSLEKVDKANLSVIYEGMDQLIGISISNGGLLKFENSGNRINSTQEVGEYKIDIVSEPDNIRQLTFKGATNGNISLEKRDDRFYLSSTEDLNVSVWAQTDKIVSLDNIHQKTLQVFVEDNDIKIYADSDSDDRYETEIYPVSKSVYHIYASSSVGGIIDPSGEIIVNKGENKEFIITPDDKYAVKDVVVDGESVGAVTAYKFSDIKTDHTIVVSFQLRNNASFESEHGSGRKTGREAASIKYPYLTDLGTHVYTGTWMGDRIGWKLLLSNGSALARNQWAYLNEKWYLFDKNGYMLIGWANVNGEWYYLNKDGSMAVGWICINGKWYYLNANGAMATGWVQVSDKWYHLNADGAMETGWILVSGKWYYLGNDGAMFADTITPDGYRVGSDGAWIQ